MTLPLERVLARIGPLAREGVTFHWLRPNSKAPIASKWSEAPAETLADLEKSHVANANVGVRLGELSKVSAGYLYLIDLDIRDESKKDECLAALRSMWPDYDRFPTVISGSGGESRHIYLVSDGLFRSKKLARSPGFQMVWNDTKGREVKQHDWEIEFFGTGKQAVVPPSIHPDTGRAYEWLREFDELDIGLGDWPVVSAEDLKSWGARADAATGDEFDDDADELFAEAKSEPIGLGIAEIERTVADLPDDWVDDRDQWFIVGMALHHETGGGDDGFEIWCDWSQQSSKFDREDQLRVWKSFGKNKRTNPVRMPTLVAAAGENRLKDAHDFVQVDEIEDAEFEDLLPPSKPADPLDDLLGPTSGGDLIASPSKSVTGQISYTPGDRDLEKQDGWESWLQRNEDGLIKSTMPNVQLIIRNDPRTRGVMAFNKFKQEIVLIRKPRLYKLRKESPKPVLQLEGSIWNVSDKVNGDNWTDSHEHPIRRIIEGPTRQGGYDIKVTDRDLKAATDMVALENSFHPVTDYLNAMAASWDGVTGRAEELFIKYLGCPDDPYHREVARNMLLGAVTRAFEPGHKFDFVTILQGAQGKRKSTFIEVLARSWGGELAADFHDKQKMVESMMGSWILEIPELQGFSRADVTSLKAFLTLNKDRTRLAYERRARDFYRQCIFIGSTNDDEYLRDDTGGRRYWIVKCNLQGEIDTEGLAAEIDQVWGEVVNLYRKMRKDQPDGKLPLYLKSEDAKSEAERFQEGARVATSEESIVGEIEQWVNTPIGAEFEDLDGDKEPEYLNVICAKQIWCEMWGRDASQFDTKQSMMIGKALRKLPGWTLHPTRIKVSRYGKQRVYVRDGTDPILE